MSSLPFVLASFLLAVPASAQCLTDCVSADSRESSDSGSMNGAWLDKQAAQSLSNAEATYERDRAFDDGVAFGLQQSEADRQR